MPQAGQRALTIIERHASAQAKLIDDMLDMARIVAGKLRLELKPVDLASVVTSAVDVVAPEAMNKQLVLRTHLESSTAQVLGDRLEQVVGNLLSNAFKFTPAGGSIDVRMTMAHRFVSIAVSDTGQGIQSESCRTCSIDSARAIRRAPRDRAASD